MTIRKKSRKKASKKKTASKKRPSSLKAFLDYLDLEPWEVDLTDKGDLQEVFSSYTRVTVPISRPKKPKQKPKQKPRQKPKQKPKQKPTPRKPKPKTRELIEVEEITHEYEERGHDVLWPTPSEHDLVDGAELVHGVYYVESVSPLGYLEHNQDFNDSRVMVAGHINKAMRNFAEVFDKVYRDKLTSHTPFDDVDDLPLGRFGIVLRTIKGMETRAIATRVICELAPLIGRELPDGYAAHIVDEGRNIAIRIGFGEYNRKTLWSDGKEEMKQNELLLERIAEILSEETGRDCLWMPFWEWPEEHANY